MTTEDFHTICSSDKILHVNAMKGFGPRIVELEPFHRTIAIIILNVTGGPSLHRSVGGGGLLLLVVVLRATSVRAG